MTAPPPTAVVDDFCALLCELFLHRLPALLLQLSFDAPSPATLAVKAVVSRSATEPELQLLAAARTRGRQIVGEGFSLDIVKVATLDQAPEPATWPIFAAAGS